MVKMSLGNSTSQGSSTSSISSSRISAYNGAISSLNSFIGASNLKGKAYNSAKDYASTVLLPLIQGAILLSEAVSNAVTTFPSSYTSEVAEEDLDSEVLEAQIATYQAAYDRSSAWLTSEMSKEVLNESSILRAEQSMARNLGKVTELQEKLDKLMAFNASSPSLFDEISGLYSAVSQGLSQVNNSFSSYNGTFSLPSKEELSWATTITTAWEEREKVIEVLQKGGQFSAEDAQLISDYLGAGVEADKTIYLYDNFYGYAKYKLSQSYEHHQLTLKMTTEKSKIKSDFGDFSEDGYSGTSEFPVLGTALGVIYNVDVDRESVTNASIGLKSGDTQTKAGVKYVNGTLTAYNSTKTKIKPSVAEDYTLTGTYEQGKYLRTTDTGEGNYYDLAGATMERIPEVGQFMWEHPGEVITGTAVGVAVASALIVGVVLSSPGVAIAGIAIGVIALFSDKDNNGDA